MESNARMDSQMDPVIISIQVSFMAVPYYIAQKEGYFDELKVNPSTVVYPSGAPQVKAAVEEKAWDIGVAGVVPNIIGGSQGLLGIGICFDQSAINQLVGNARGVELWPPESMDGVSIAVSPSSTGDYIAKACLKAQGYNLTAINWIETQQAGIIEAMLPGENGTEPLALYGGLWAPHTYRFLESDQGSKVLCRGDTVYKTITGGFMVREEFARDKSDVVMRVMAAWLRGVEFVKDKGNKAMTLQYMDDFYNEQEVSLTVEAMEEDMKLITLYSLDEQIALMQRKGNPPSSSEYDFWTIDISEFMLQNGVVDSYEDPMNYITDEFFLAIRDDPELAAYARFQPYDGNSGTWRHDGWPGRLWFSLYLVFLFLRR